MTAPALPVTKTQRVELVRMASSTTLPHRQVVQAKALLWAAQGVANQEIARRCEVDSDAVRGDSQRGSGRLMRVLLDEAVPTQLLEPLQHLTKGRHDIAHVVDTRLKGRKDVPLLRMAVELGFDAIVTNDIAQLADPAETKAIAKSKLHHIRYSQRQLGLRGLALALGALVAELPTILDELSSITSQRLVRVHGLDPKKRRFDIIDPSSDPPAYWPRRRSRP